MTHVFIISFFFKSHKTECWWASQTQPLWENPSSACNDGMQTVYKTSSGDPNDSRTKGMTDKCKDDSLELSGLITMLLCDSDCECHAHNPTNTIPPGCLYLRERLKLLFFIKLKL